VAVEMRPPNPFTKSIAFIRIPCTFFGLVSMEYFAERCLRPLGLELAVRRAGLEVVRKIFTAPERPQLWK